MRMSDGIERGRKMRPQLSMGEVDTQIAQGFPLYRGYSLIIFLLIIWVNSLKFIF